MTGLAFRSRTTLKGFTRHSASLPSVGVDNEPTAAAHYMFGTDNPTYVDENGANALTANGTVPTLSANYFTTIAAGLNGMVTPFADSHSFSMAIVVRASIGGSSRQVLIDNLSADQKTGIGLTNTPDVPSFLYALINGIGVNAGTYQLTQPGGMVNNSWVMLFLSERQGVGSRRANGAISPAAAQDQTAYDGSVGVTTLRPLHGSPIGIGPVYQGASLRSAVAIASLAYWSTERTDDELAAYYVREKARLAARSITLI